MTEEYFKAFRQNTIGIGQHFESPFGTKEIIYADWTASGRLYAPIEKAMAEKVGPYVANTHTETSITGTLMTKAYHEARHVIKQHVNAFDTDALLFAGSGMTGAVNKLQRILGLRMPNNINKYLTQSDSKSGKLAIDTALKPVVFVTHMEHHSNQTSWLETVADVEIIPAADNGLVAPENLLPLLEKYKDRQLKIASVTACSNVTGIQTPYHTIAAIMHQAGGYCFVDFACSGPYVSINMHPENEDEHLDAIFLSPHKFLGGPGTSGIVIFNAKLYNNAVPDNPGGGTVVYTNPWRVHKYITDIELREDGGTPPFLQAIRTAMAIKLKEAMGIENILHREHDMVKTIIGRLQKIEKIHVLAGEHTDRLGVISFIVKDMHYNMMVKLLNDKFGIQVRGGCACAGTYGHYLLEVGPDKSFTIMQEILSGNKAHLPGWVRLSIHPILTNAEVEYLVNSIETVCNHHEEWAAEYTYNPTSNEYMHKSSNESEKLQHTVESWFEFKPSKTLSTINN